jgi:serine/threonine protein kinase, bacterial
MIRLKLLDSQDQSPLKMWDFEHEFVVRIGRSPDNNIILNDPLVSRYHLELRKLDNSAPDSNWYLVNHGTNGTFVNGVLMSQGILLNGALIQLARGGPIFQFELSSPPSPINNSPSGQPVSIPSCSHAGNPPNNLFCIHCGQPIKVERTIRQYQILRVLGQGGMGTTNLAWDREKALNQLPNTPAIASLVVLKEMNADLVQIAKAQELFEREARTLKSLKHPGIPKFFDCFVEEGKKYLVMEMIHGQDLEKRVFERGPVIIEQAIAWMVQTCEILDYIHSQDPPIIHRDIKPANLLARHRDNRIILLDFGAVKEIGTPPGTRIGVEGYTAPEQDRGQPVIQSDLYAIAPTLIFLLTAQSPNKFLGKGEHALGFNVDNVPTITPKLRNLIAKVTNLNPRDRPQSAMELATALTDCL